MVESGRETRFCTLLGKDCCMFKKMLIVVFYFVICANAWGEIVAPEKTDLGKLIPITSTDNADIFIWSVPDGLDFMAIEGNKKLICTGLEGSYKVQLTTITIDWTTKQITQSPQQSKMVMIGKGAPPDPVDPVVPDPVLTGVAKEVYDWSKTVATHRDCAKELSGNYKTIAAKFASMTVTIEQAMTQLRELNNKVLDTREEKDAWAVFGSRLEEKLNSVWPMEKTLFVSFLNEVSLGLSYVK